MATLAKTAKKVPLLRQDNTLHSAMSMQRCQGRPVISDAHVWGRFGTCPLSTLSSCEHTHL